MSAAIGPAALASLYLDHIEHLRDGYSDALAEAGWDGVLIHAGRAGAKSPFDDQYWPHRPTPHFAHWLPLADEDAALLVRPGLAPILYRPTATSFWDGRPPAPDADLLAAFELVDVDDPAALGPLLPTGALAFLGADAARAASVGFGPDRRNPAALTATLDQLRAIKSPYERACVAEANRRAAAGHLSAQDAFRAGARSELDLHLAYLAATEQDDADTPYKNIVALGAHAGVLHHVHYGRERVAGDTSLLVDAGARFRGYHADITRTTVRGDSDGARTFAALIARIETLQQTICARIEAGLPYEALHDLSHELLAELLRDAGLARASAEALVATGVTRALFPHGLGHALGLQTHDVGCRLLPPAERNPFLRNTSTIAEGQVFTIEPGCYFIPSLLDGLRAGPHAGSLDWALIDRLSPFGGIRIEDNVAVEGGRARNLTREYLPA